MSDRCPACGVPSQRRYDRGDGDDKRYLCMVSNCRVDVFRGETA